MSIKTRFQGDISFCPACGTLLPDLPTHGSNVSCLACRVKIPVDHFASVEVKYSVAFNDRSKLSKASAIDHDEDEDEGPVVERRCPKCGHEKMSYAALQLRSADEGQTVFYTCLKCKFKETENS